MKKNQFVKFSLTLVCAGVLAACSSSSNNSNDEAAKKAAAEKAAQEALVQQQLAAEAQKKAEEEAAKKAAETAKTLEQGFGPDGDEGAKFVKKKQSNFVTNSVVEAPNDRSSSSVTGMTVPLYPSLDTIVVATPVDANGKARANAAQIYLEDFDFRGNDPATAVNKGRYTLNHIHNINAAEVDPAKSDEVNGYTVNATQARTGHNLFTKTDAMGNESGEAFVYEAGRLNYTKRVEGGDVLDRRVARTEFQGNGTADTGRLDNSVAEVYGFRTFVTGDSVTGLDGNGTAANTVALAQAGQYDVSNAPFVATAPILDRQGANPSAAENGVKKVGGADGEYTAAGKLNYVQYGRVTSKLNAIGNDLDAELRAGKNIVTLGTKIASFGGYGDEGTEDHYFYRGIVSTPQSATLAADLAAKYGATHTDAQGNKTVTPAGTLDYRGHAVTYNLDRPLNLGDRVPNAIGYTHHLVSGTHATAQIDLATSQVNGRLYNVWHYSNGQTSADITDNLANFNGTLTNYGSIVGKSNKLNSDGSVAAQGNFAGSLFGPNAEELGGTIASTDTYNNWGASFGAAIQNVGSNTTATPPTTGGALGESTDQRNLANPNIGN